MKFNCPNPACGQPLEVDEAEFVGIKFNCPRCSQSLEIDISELERRTSQFSPKPIKIPAKYIGRIVEHPQAANRTRKKNNFAAWFLFMLSLGVVTIAIVVFLRHLKNGYSNLALDKIGKTITQKSDQKPQSEQPIVQATPIISTECWFSGEANSETGLLKAPQGKIFLWTRWRFNLPAIQAVANAKYSVDSSKCILIMPDGTRCLPVASLSTHDENNTLRYVATAYSISVNAVKHLRFCKLQLLDGMPVSISPVLQPYNMLEGKPVDNRWPVAFKGDGSFNFENGKIATKTMKIYPESANGWFLTIIERFPNGMSFTTDSKQTIWENHPFEIRDMEGTLLYSGCSNVIFNVSDVEKISTASIKVELPALTTNLSGQKKDISRPPEITRKSRKYIDPKGRFSCFIPEGWQIDIDTSNDPRSKVRFFKGKDEIRIISRSTGRHILDESDKKEFMDGIEIMLSAVRRKGGQGRSLGVTETSIDGENGYLISLELERPHYLLVKQVKYKKDNWDHLVGLYIYTKSNSDKLLSVFENFLSNFTSNTGKQ